jgi:hypothetical protein
LWQRGFWIASALAAACCLPILIWNAQHDWVTVKHVFRLAGLKTAEASPVEQHGRSMYWEGPFIYLGTQFALLLGFWFAAWVAAMWAYRPWKDDDDGRRYLWWLSMPMFAVFLAFSVKTKGGEANWPITTYIAGMVLTAGWLSRQWSGTVRWYRRTMTIGLAAVCGVGLLLTLLLHHTEWAHPMMMKFAGAPTREQPFPIRRIDPTCRLRGWHTLGAALDQVCDELRADGIEPVVVCSGWTLPGEVGFYSTAHPTVYSVGPILGDRRSQYDLWRPNPVADGEAFQGRTFVIIGGAPTRIAGAFDSVEAPRSVIHYDQGLPVAGWTLVVCHGFRGFPRVPGYAEY